MTILDMIRERATLSQAYGSNRPVDVSNPASAMLPRTLAQWQSWEHHKTANDHTTEQLLNIARNLLEGSVDQVPRANGRSTPNRAIRELVEGLRNAEF
jgi:hypothetical protein